MTTKVIVTFALETMDDSEGDISYLQREYSDVADLAEREKYKAQDAKRLAAYQRGGWHFIGIRAKATICVNRDDHQQAYAAFYELSSPGLRGVESDSGNNYLAELYAEQVAELKSDIEAMKLAEFK